MILTIGIRLRASPALQATDVDPLLEELKARFLETFDLDAARGGGNQTGHRVRVTP